MCRQQRPGALLLGALLVCIATAGLGGTAAAAAWCLLLLGFGWRAGWLAGVGSVEPSPVSLAPGSAAAPPTLFQLCADGLTDGELMRERGNIQPPDTPAPVVAGAV